MIHDIHDYMSHQKCHESQKYDSVPQVRSPQMLVVTNGRIGCPENPKTKLERRLQIQDFSKN